MLNHVQYTDVIYIYLRHISLFHFERNGSTAVLKCFSCPEEWRPRVADTFPNLPHAQQSEEVFLPDGRWINSPASEKHLVWYNWSITSVRESGCKHWLNEKSAEPLSLITLRYQHTATVDWYLLWFTQCEETNKVREKATLTVMYWKRVTSPEPLTKRAPFILRFR